MPPSIRALQDDTEYGALSPEAKGIVFDRLAPQDAEFRQLSPEAQGVMRRRLLGDRPAEPGFFTRVGQRVGEIAREASPTNFIRGIAAPYRFGDRLGQQPLAKNVRQFGDDVLEGAGAAAAMANLPFTPIEAIAGVATERLLGRGSAETPITSIPIPFTEAKIPITPRGLAETAAGAVVADPRALASRA